MNIYYAAFACTILGLAGCQTINTPVQTTVEKPKAKLETKAEETGSTVKITPYPDSGIVSQSQNLPTTNTPTPPRIILPNQSYTPPRNLKDGHGIAAYNSLMHNYLSSLRSDDLNDAEKSLIQAQRIAPQSADVYRELARLTNLKKQGANAESFARKGLTFARNNTQRKQLWQQIFTSAQMRNNAALMQQAQQQISRY